MTLYRYSAIEPGGDVVSGTLDAASERDAVLALRAQSRTPLSLTPAADGAAPHRSFLDSLRPQSKPDLLMLMRSLSALLNSGMPLARALRATGEATEHAPTLAFIQRMERSVAAGNTLSHALSQDPSFDGLVVSMVRAGEDSGQLGLSLARVTEHLRRANALHGEILSALAYPALLVVAAIGAIAAIVFFVVPRFKDAFVGFEDQLPPATRAVIAVSDAIRAAGPFILPGAGLLAIWILTLWRSKKWRARLDLMLLDARVVGPYLRRSEFSRFLRVLGMSLEAGVPLPSALNSAKNSLSNMALQHGVADAIDTVRGGQKLSTALIATRRCPPLALQMLRIGEETGALGKAALDAADFFEEESERTLKRFVSILEPALILAMAAFVGGIVVSLMIGIMSINQLALS